MRLFASIAERQELIELVVLRMGVHRVRVLPECRDPAKHHLQNNMPLDGSQYRNAYFTLSAHINEWALSVISVILVIICKFK